MLSIIFIIILCLFIWNLLIQGLLWKMIIGIFGWIGIYKTLVEYVPQTKSICFTFSGKSFSWCEIIPTFILLMAILYKKD